LRLPWNEIGLFRLPAYKPGRAAISRHTASPLHSRPMPLPPGRNPVPRLRLAGLVEGVSFLVLLGIAMPLKHLAGRPGAVLVVGWAHGLLFVLFCAALLHTTIAARWPLARAALVFAAALHPFGPFALDRRMKRYAAQYGQ